MSGSIDTLDKRLLAHSFVISNFAFNTDPLGAKREAVESMRAQVACHLSCAKITEHRGEYQTTLRLEVYVLSPDELHRMIQDEAIKLNQRFALGIKSVD